jgi:multicomponent Na+:H+ antiporter subunit B
VVSPLLRGVARLLFAPSLLVAAAMIVKGYTDVGDGFAAGVIVALAVAVQYVAVGPRESEAALPVLRFAPYVGAAGLLLGLAVGFFPLLLGEPIFTHQPPAGVTPAKIGTLELITAVLFDLAVFMVVLGVLVQLMHHLAYEEEAAPTEAATSDERAGEERAAPEGTA